MKKSILGALAVGVFILGWSSATITIRNADGTNINGASNVVATTQGAVKNEMKVDLMSSSETVYAITDAEGKIKKSFVGSEPNTTGEALPIKVKLSYYLDDKEVSASEIAGKTGHAKIVYNYSSAKEHEGKQVPFVVLSGAVLDKNVFTNIKLTNGKVVSNDQNLTVIGYSVVGLNENLGTDLLPQEFIIEADVTNFKFDTSYTVATNELIADLDTSKLSSVNELVSSINQLAAGFDIIVAGSSSLKSGMNALYDGLISFQNGATELSAGAYKLSDGAKQLSNGLDQVVDLHNNILGKAEKIIDEAERKIQEKIDAIIEKYDIPEEAIEKIKELIKPIEDVCNKVANGVISYTDGIKQLADGARQLSDGIDQLAYGASALFNGSVQLRNGALQLNNGTNALHSGLVTFRNNGISRLADFANNDVAGFMNNFKKSVEAAKSYKYYQDSSADSVKFVFKSSGV